jgi:hydroxymethylglutaryl-CoA reductase
VAQVQLLDVPSPKEAAHRITQQQVHLLDVANLSQPGMKRRGGGAQKVEVRLRELKDGRLCLLVHLLVDVCDAMGANVLNTMAEAVAPRLEEWTQGRAVARILSNYADKRVVTAECAIPVSALATDEFDGSRIAQGVVELSLLAEADVHRAVTHNKGIMNGVDAVALATGNDWRAIEAGCHAFAARNGRYAPLATWRIEHECLMGKLEMPLQMGIAGSSIRKNPMAEFALDRLLKVSSSNDLCEVTAAVGLAQNLAALRALGSEGIIRGHMALHRRRL